MIDLYYWTTPNGHKVTLFLEEAELEYRILPVHIGRGEQFAPEFLAHSPNNRIPAIVDHAPADNGKPVSVFESGAILLYLADKIGKFIPREARARAHVLQWLMWQMGGLGPMLGQNHHFRGYAPEQIPYAVKRYTDEANRLYSVLNKQLNDSEYVCGEYSIADMACYPWCRPHERQGVSLSDYPNVARWMEAVQARPATARAYQKAEQLNTAATVDDEARKFLFGQTSPQAPDSAADSSSKKS